MSDLELEISCLSSNSDTASNASDTDENMDFRENRDSENDTEVIESLFAPYTDEPIAPPDYAEAEDDDEDPDGLAAKTLADREDGLIPLPNW